ncbi:Hypothetical protein AJAP_28070 [Amycolatopsis japonica]|uniref:Terminase small subunit n=1 Tax=Amycolatopsis japonica TaxID=208439 RepID=A0A075UZP8_9PSEU|nr:hypothetical protein [Amycolatopsis japonica]AIG78453.1 Hypothetical protein AJAP_28070 [Amycolatopsis japonica]
MTDTKPKAPRGLKTAGRRLWADIVSEWDLRPDELRVLGDACREADLIERLEKGLETAPLTAQGSMGQEVIHPLWSEVRQHRTTLASLLRQLKLAEVDEGAGAVSDTPAKPMTRQESAKKAAQARWGT